MYKTGRFWTDSHDEMEINAPVSWLKHRAGAPVQGRTPARPIKVELRLPSLTLCLIPPDRAASRNACI